MTDAELKKAIQEYMDKGGEVKIVPKGKHTLSMTRVLVPVLRIKM